MKVSKLPWKFQAGETRAPVINYNQAVSMLTRNRFSRVVAEVRLFRDGNKQKSRLPIIIFYINGACTCSQFTMICSNFIDDSLQIKCHKRNALVKQDSNK